MDICNNYFHASNTSCCNIRIIFQPTMIIMTKKRAEDRTHLNVYCLFSTFVFAYIWGYNVLKNPSMQFLIMKYFSNTWVFLLSISSTTNKLLAFIFFVAVARVLSAEDYGVFRYLIALSSFFFIPLSGVPFALTRYVSKNVASSDSAAKYLFNSVILGSVIIFPIFFTENLKDCCFG